uniref:Uncharacterized protein n=1 Tax=Solanum tuberosum TaxID=4113 RepID=M1BU52_SOLTU
MKNCLSLSLGFAGYYNVSSLGSFVFECWSRMKNELNYCGYQVRRWCFLTSKVLELYSMDDGCLYFEKI